MRSFVAPFVHANGADFGVQGSLLAVAAAAEESDLKYRARIDIVSELSGAPGEVLAAATECSFGAAGDGKALYDIDSDAGFDFLLRCNWSKPGPTVSWLEVDLDGVDLGGVGVSETLEVIDWDGALTSTSGARDDSFSMAVHSSTSQHTFEVSIPGWVPTGQQRLMTARGAVVRDTGDLFSFQMAARDISPSDFGSIKIRTSIASHLLAGTYFILYTVPNGR